MIYIVTERAADFRQIRTLQASLNDVTNKVSLLKICQILDT
jgi:hypothetical protein